MRVPFIAAWAKPDAANAHQKRLPIAAGAIQSQQAAVYDLFPTILSLTGVATPAKHVVDGSKLDTLLTGKRDSTRNETFIMHYPHAPHRSVFFTSCREGDWKVIYHYHPSEASEGSHYQLYNLKDDPFEQKNLAATNPAELKRLMQTLITGLEAQHAAYPVENDGATPMKPKLP
jgi:arylsulfatase A-like enzyme